MDVQRMVRIGRWLDRWRYVGAIGAMLVLVVIGLHRSTVYSMMTAAGFARYMWVVAAIALGAGVARLMHRLLQHRFRAWVDEAVCFEDSVQRYAFVGRFALMAGLLVAGGVIALALLTQEHGVWPWSP